MLDRGMFCLFLWQISYVVYFTFKVMFEGEHMKSAEGYFFFTLSLKCAFYEICQRIFKLMSETGLRSRVRICCQKPYWTPQGPPRGPNVTEIFIIFNFALLQASFGGSLEGLIVFLIAYSYYTPQASFGHNLAFPVVNFIIGVISAQSKTNKDTPGDFPHSWSM